MIPAPLSYIDMMLSKIASKESNNGFENQYNELVYQSALSQDSYLDKKLEYKCDDSLDKKYI